MKKLLLAVLVNIPLIGNADFIQAIKTGNINVVINLIEDGADVNFIDTDVFLKVDAAITDNTALIAAIEFDRTNIAKILIDNNADIRITRRCGWSPLHCAAEKGNLEVVKCLCQRYQKLFGDMKDYIRCLTVRKKDALYYGARYGHLDVVKYLVENGADVNNQAIDGDSALHESASSGHLDVVQYLVRQKANIYIRNKVGQTVLHSAVKSNNIDIISYLVRCGVSVDSKDKWLETPIFLASGELLNSLEALICLGADLNLENKYHYKLKDSYSLNIENIVSDINKVELNLADFKDQTKNIQTLLVKRWLYQNKIELIEVIYYWINGLEYIDINSFFDNLAIESLIRLYKKYSINNLYHSGYLVDLLKLLKSHSSEEQVIKVNKLLRNREGFTAFSDVAIVTLS